MVIPPKSSILIGFSIIFTIHFRVSLFLETPISTGAGFLRFQQYHHLYTCSNLERQQSLFVKPLIFHVHDLVMIIFRHSRAPTKIFFLHSPWIQIWWYKHISTIKAQVISLSIQPASQRRCKMPCWGPRIEFQLLPGKRTNVPWKKHWLEDVFPIEIVPF